MSKSERLERVQDFLNTNELDGFVILNLENSDRANLRYMTGFACSLGVLIIGLDEALFMTDSRYYEAAKIEIGCCEVQKIDQQPVRTTARHMVDLNISNAAIDEKQISLKNYRKLNEHFQEGNLEGVDSPLTQMRVTKDPSELKLQQEAATITDNAIDYASETVQRGMTEQELALKLETFIRQHGAEDIAFDLIVASGGNSAYPHVQTSDKEIRRGEFLLMDIGARVDGYCSDLTRTVHLGPPSTKKKEIYDLVLQSQQKGLEELEPGRKCSIVDSQARAIIKEEGYEENFGHGLGHGVGLDVHESPKLSQTSDDTLEVGMVTSVEPGIYIPDWGGIRIEDLVVIREEGYECLSRAPKSKLINIL